jgi:di/tricarboxylate transporter
MEPQQLSVFLILGSALILFVWSRWRYDIIALSALVAAVLAGVVPINNTFSGFSNPAVITVAEVMIISHIIASTGIIYHIVKQLTKVTHNEFLHITTLTFIAAFFSAFMNNVGALALLMPIAIETVRKHDRSPAFILMPLAFASLLGGLITLIGTPPNILIANIRADVLGEPFAMFDFAPVGLSITIIGLIFLVTIGWRLIPKARLQHKASEDVFHIQDYITEVRVTENSNYIGKTFAEIEHSIEEGIVILGLIRDERKRLRLRASEILQAEDILIVQAASSDLEDFLQETKFALVGNEKVTTEVLRSEKVSVQEVVVPPGSQLEGRTVRRLRLREYHQVNLLALARAGSPFNRRLYNVGLQAGDILLLQGPTESLMESIADLGFLPLAERRLSIGVNTSAFLPLLFFIGALLLTAFSIFPVQLSFAIAILFMLLSKAVNVKQLRDSVDWPVIVLLAAMIPVGNALQSTGGSELIAQGILTIANYLPTFLILTVVMVITMFLSDIMNNAATTLVMAPIAIGLAQALNHNIDPYLMSVAVGASCAFLTPIGHQNNTLIMGPGGYHFSDYWRMGLPLEILIVLTAIPTILWVWPI